MGKLLQNRVWRFHVFVFVFVFVLLATREMTLRADGRLHVYFLDVSQGDSTLLVSPSGKQVLIDGGPDQASLEHLGNLMPFFDRTIELLVLTHPDSDHVSSLAGVLKRYRVERVLLTGVQHDLGRYEAMLFELTDRQIPLLLPDPSQDIDLGDGLVLDIVWPDEALFGDGPRNMNNTSIVLRALFGEHAVLLTGDIEEEAEVAILASGADVSSDILKVPHHGSKSSSMTGFILAVDPDLAVVSAGRGNRYGHPHKEIVQRYETLGIALRSTAKEGTISLSFE